MILKMILARSKTENTEAMQIALQQLNKLDIESIGVVDGTEYAKAIKLLAEKFAKENKYFETPEVIALLERIIFHMPMFKKYPEEKCGKRIVRGEEDG